MIAPYAGPKSAPAKARPARPVLGIVVPVFHNAGSLVELHLRLTALESSAGVSLRLWFVDDGSADDSFAVLRRLAHDDDRVQLLRLSRNFGSFAAIRCGLDHSLADGTCDAVAVLSADLQDPPEHLMAMVSAWQAGSDVVLAERASRDDPWLTRLTSALHHGLFRRVALRGMPAGGFDFFLLDAVVARAVTRHREKATSLPGLIVWAGYRRTVLPYDRQRRTHGRSMWRLGRRAEYAIDTYVAFTPLPLRLASLAGGLFLTLGLLAAALALVGYAGGLLATVMLVGGCQLVSVGILGEYLWRLLERTQDRPTYLVAEHWSAAAGQARQAA